MELQSRTGYIGKSMPRKEDRRLLLGQGQYIADLTLPGMLHAVFVRSTVAHARIKSVDLSRAAAAPGVRFVMSGIELAKELPLELERVHPLSRDDSAQDIPAARAAARLGQGPECGRGSRRRRRR